MFLSVVSSGGTSLSESQESKVLAAQGTASMRMLTPAQSMSVQAFAKNDEHKPPDREPLSVAGLPSQWSSRTVAVCEIYN